jgi:hypothetical protein
MVVPISKFLEFAQPGHFYSPIPDPAELELRRQEIFDTSAKILPGIDLRTAEQLAFLDQLFTLSGEFPYTATNHSHNYRYSLDNLFFTEPDAFTLHSFVRIFRPKRIVEIGSGYSSALILDTIDHFLDYQLDLLCVEPAPSRLKNLLGPEDMLRVRIFPTTAQSVPIEEFLRLETSDFLFIDSSHVGKCGSDVLHLLFNVIPRLPPGVFVHVHDIFWPFEYPENWYHEGRCWNEIYLVRAMLMFNAVVRIFFWPSFLESCCPQRIREISQYNQHAGGSLWLRRMSDETVCHGMNPEREE